MTPTSFECQSARRWLSAARDGEAPEDAPWRDHLVACDGCGSWFVAFDQLTRVARLRAPRPSNDLRGQLGSFLLDRAPTPPALLRARVVLGLAALGCAGSVVLGAAGIFGHAHLGSPEGRDAEAFLLSLTGGYALTAWRPARLAAGLLPVAFLAAVVTTVMSVVALTAGDTTLSAELPHLPILLGAAGATAAFRATSAAPRRGAPTRRREPAHA